MASARISIRAALIGRKRSLAPRLARAARHPQKQRWSSKLREAGEQVGPEGTNRLEEMRHGYDAASIEHHEQAVISITKNTVAVGLQSAAVSG
jgi:hypothetical protein